MTTEKIISVLETTRLMFEMSLDDSDCDEDSAEAREDNEETVEAINEAIKALKREPCEDCISRQAVLDVIEREQFKGDAVSEIEKLPPVTPERPKGEWKTDGHGHIYCTACNQTNVSMWKSDFCPICGSYNGQTRKE